MSVIRVLFFGTSEFAVPSLARLLDDARFEVIAVVTQPDRPKGRGQQLHQSPVKELAVSRGCLVLQPPKVRFSEFVDEVRAMAPDAFALASFGQIIPQALLDIPPLGPINVHGSLLPNYRGAAPIQYAIWNGDAQAGVTTMWMEASLDTGDMLLARAIPIGPEETSETLIPRLAEVGAELLVETLIGLSEGICPRKPQNHDLATHSPSIKPDQQKINWTQSANRICNHVRAFYPRPGVYAFHGEKKLKVWRAASDAESTDTEPSAVVKISKQSVTVKAGDGAVELLEVQPENSKRMSGADWARGARISVGDRLS